MMQTFRRFQLAVRLHLAVRRHLGESINLTLLLRHPRYAREVIDLCHDSGVYTLDRLARCFATANGAHSARAHLAMAATTTRAELAMLKAPASFGPAAPAGVRAVALDRATPPRSTLWVGRA